MQSIPEDIQNLIPFKAANVWSEREQTGLQYPKYLRNQIPIFVNLYTKTSYKEIKFETFKCFTTYENIIKSY